MLIALPGYWFAIALIERMGRYWMQQMGFAMCLLWFAVLAGGYNGTSGLGYTAAASTGFVSDSLCVRMKSHTRAFLQCRLLYMD